MSTSNELGEAHLWKMIEPLEDAVQQIVRANDRLVAIAGPPPRPALRVVTKGGDDA